MERVFTRYAQLAVLGCALTLLGATNASAFPIGDDYFVSATNFPTTFAAGGPLIFNSTPQLVPNSGGQLGVVGTDLGFAGPHGGDVLEYSFFILDATGLDPNSGFAFNLTGIGDPGSLTYDAAFIQADFGATGVSPIIDISPYTAVAELSNGLALGVSTGATTWTDLLTFINPSATAPDSIRVNFFAEVTVPEPGTGLLFGSGAILAALVWSQGRSRRAPAR